MYFWVNDDLPICLGMEQAQMLLFYTSLVIALLGVMGMLVTAQNSRIGAKFVTRETMIKNQYE